MTRAIQRDILCHNLSKKGFSKKIVDAFKLVKREDFVDVTNKAHAYEDIAIPVGKHASVSQPTTLAFVLELLELTKKIKVLEIGSGTGYALALISKLSSDAELFGVEINTKLAKESSERLALEGNIIIFARDGKKGLPEQGPYDRILISAECEKEPVHLLPQLAEGGILVFALRNSLWQLKKTKTSIIEREFPGFWFVPLQ